MSQIRLRYRLVSSYFELLSLVVVACRKVFMYSDCLAINGFILLSVLLILTIEPEISVNPSRDSLASAKV